MLQSGLELKLKVLKRNDKGAEFGSQEEGASSEGRPVWVGRPASPRADTFCYGLNEAASLGDLSYHFPFRLLLSSHTDLCTSTNALSPDFGMAASFSSFRSQLEHRFQELL